MISQKPPIFLTILCGLAMCFQWIMKGHAEITTTANEQFKGKEGTQKITNLKQKTPNVRQKYITELTKSDPESHPLKTKGSRSTKTPQIGIPTNTIEYTDVLEQSDNEFEIPMQGTTSKFLSANDVQGTNSLGATKKNVQNHVVLNEKIQVVKEKLLNVSKRSFFETINSSKSATTLQDDWIRYEEEESARKQGWLKPDAPESATYYENKSKEGRRFHRMEETESSSEIRRGLEALAMAGSAATWQRETEVIWRGLREAVTTGPGHLSTVLVAWDGVRSLTPTLCPGLTASLLLHTVHVPLLVVNFSDASRPTDNERRFNKPPLPWPSAIALPLAVRGRVRAHLHRLLSWLRGGRALWAAAATAGAAATAPWHKGTRVFVLHDRMAKMAAPTAEESTRDVTEALRTEALNIQRAFARAEMLRPAAGLLPNFDDGHVFLYTPAPRPMRPPELTSIEKGVAAMTDPRMLKFPGHSFVYAIYTKNEEEAWCLEDNSWHWPESARELALVTAEHMHARAVCWSHREDLSGTRFPNGTYSELARAVVGGQADVLLLAPRSFPEWEKECDLFYPHYMDELCLWVRKAGRMSFSESVVSAFQRDVWLWTGCSLASLALARVLAQRWWRGARESDAVIAVVETLRAFLAYTGLQELPRVQGRRRGRSLVSAVALATAVFGLVVLTAFQGTFTSLLATPRSLPDMATLQEAGERLGAAYTYADWPQKLRTDNSPQIRRFAKVLHPVHKNWYLIVADILKYGDTGLLMNGEHAKFFIFWKGFGGTGYSKMHRVPECVLTGSPMNFVTRKNSPYFPSMDALLRRAIETGLYAFWKGVTEAAMRARFSLVRAAKGAEVLRPYALKIKHLKGALALLGWGLAAAGMAFLAEVAWTRVDRYCHCQWKR